jgi:hypothetical protein
MPALELKGKSHSCCTYHFVVPVAVELVEDPEPMMKTSTSAS